MTQRYVILLLISFLVISCGGGSSAPVTPANDSTLYIGYYTEDPADPDPTPGVMYMYIPNTDTSFNGEFFFSYIGCIGSFDTGLINAAKTGNNLAGTWAGDVDGTASSGNFNASTVNDSIYTGSWTRNGGSQDFNFTNPTCGYTFAGNGDFNLFKIANGTTNISVSLINPFSPVFSWTSRAGTLGYGLNVFDKACLINGGSITTCTMWGDFGPVTSSVTYGLGNSGYSAKTLVSGNSYVVAQILIGSFGTVLDFASNEFTVP